MLMNSLTYCQRIYNMTTYKDIIDIIKNLNKKYDNQDKVLKHLHMAFEYDEFYKLLKDDFLRELITFYK